MSDSIKTTAIILNSIRWKDSSKIVTLFTEHLGKVKVIARGVYRNNSAFAGKLESMTLTEAVVLNKESRSLQILKEIEVLDSWMILKNDLKFYPYGIAVLEIVSQILEENHPDPVFYNFIVEMIKSIPKTAYPENVFIYVLLKISSYLGFKPNLQTCASDDLDKCDQTVFLAMDGGNIFCKNCGVMGMNLLKLKKEQFFYLKNLQNQNYRRISTWNYHQSTARQLIYLLLNYINYHMDRELKLDALAMLPH